MPSPFPGMDPYIEGQRWSDFHHRLVPEIAAALVPVVRPRYEVLVEEHVFVEPSPEIRLRAIVPDVSVLRSPVSDPPSRGCVATASRPVAGILPVPAEIRQPYLELRFRESGDLVTVIELLSPWSKRPGGAGRSDYLEKRVALLHSDVHLVEIDLLRAGERLPMGAALPPADYYVIVSQAPRRPCVDIWPFTLREPMPSVLIPLRGDDPDAPLSLQPVFDAVFDRAGYDYSLRRDTEVVPPLTEEDADWARAVLGSATRDGTQT